MILFCPLSNSIQRERNASGDGNACCCRCDIFSLFVVDIGRARKSFSRAEPICRLENIRCSDGIIIIDILLNKNKNRIKHKGIIHRAMRKS
jgi:hypothetical protein